ncbi:amino acid ABC transporter permease [Streptomyces sp. NPDC001948]
MAWDEWEQLKAQVAERHATHTQINGLQAEGGYAKSAGAGGGGGTGTLKHKGGPWTKAAGTADGLQTSTTTAKVDLRRAHDGTVGGLAGLSSLGALKSVLTSWDERLGRVRAECGSLEPKLRQVAVEFAEVDAGVGDSAKAVTVPGTRRGE